MKMLNVQFKKMLITAGFLGIFTLFCVTNSFATPSSYGLAQHNEPNPKLQDLSYEDDDFGIKWRVNGGAWGNETQLFLGDTIEFQYSLHKTNVGNQYADVLKSWADWGQDGQFNDDDTIIYRKRNLIAQYGQKGLGRNTKANDYEKYHTDTFTLDTLGEFWFRARVTCTKSLLSYTGDKIVDYNENKSYDWEKAFQATGALRRGESTDWMITVAAVPSSPVPEPATMFLFGIGLLGLAGVNRRKK